MTEVYERSASSSSESDSETYTSSETDASYTDSEEEEGQDRSLSLGEVVLTAEEEEEESMIIKSGVEDVPITLTETKWVFYISQNDIFGRLFASDTDATDVWSYVKFFPGTKMHP